MNPMRLLFLCVLAVCVTGALFALDEVEFETSYSVNWDAGILTVEVSAPVAERRFNAPTAGFRVEQAIDQRLPLIFQETVLDLKVDSRSTIEDLVLGSPQLYDGIENLSRQGRKLYTRRSADLRSVRVRYEFNLYPGLATLFVNHRRAGPMPSFLEWVPTREFTGVVIYAQEELPVHGEEGSTHLEPALFPGIYDLEAPGVLGRRILERQTADPDWAARWGTAGYTDSLNENIWIERVGQNPLRILARGIFGIHDTDIIIDRDDADILLAHEANRRLLREGRVLIILNSVTSSEGSSEDLQEHDEADTGSR